MRKTMNLYDENVFGDVDNWNEVERYELERKHAGLKDHEIDYLMFRKSRVIQEEF